MTHEDLRGLGFYKANGGMDYMLNPIDVKLLYYLFLVKMNGVAFLDPFSRAKHCSLTSPGMSPPAPALVKGHTPLVLDPLPPMFINDAL